MHAHFYHPSFSQWEPVSAVDDFGFLQGLPLRVCVCTCIMCYLSLCVLCVYCACILYVCVHVHCV